MTAPGPAIEPLLDVKEVARTLRLAGPTVRKLIASGELRSVRIGDRRLVRVEDLRSFIAEHLSAA